MAISIRQDCRGTDRSWTAAICGEVPGARVDECRASVARSLQHGGWTFEYERGDDGGTFKLDELMEAEVQLLGRKLADTKTVGPDGVQIQI